MPAHEQPPFVDELAVALERLNLSVDQLAGQLGAVAAREPLRDPWVIRAARLVRSGACELSWLDVSNDAGAAVGFLHLWDEYNPDSIVLGDTNPRLTVAVKANDVRELRLPRPLLFRRGIIVAASADRWCGQAIAQGLLVDLITTPAAGVTGGG